MDAYCLLRFNYLCLKICLFASFWGLCVLVPVYATGSGDASDIDMYTLVNIKDDGGRLVRAPYPSAPSCGKAGALLNHEHSVPCPYQVDLLSGAMSETVIVGVAVGLVVGLVGATPTDLQCHWRDFTSRGAAACPHRRRPWV